MSFIPKNPLSLPEIEHTPSTPSGTRGLFAGKDGWYEVDAKGVKRKLVFGDDMQNEVQAVKSLQYYGNANIVPSDVGLFTFGTDEVTMTAALSGVAKQDEYGDPDIEGEIVIPYEYIKDKKVYSVTNIGDYAFNYCASLTSIEIPDRITNIGDYAFFGCDSLTDVYFKGTKEQWDAIEIGSDNGNLLNATIHYEWVETTKGYVDEKIKEVVIQGGGTVVDAELDLNSENPVQNKVITAKFNEVDAKTKALQYYGDASIVPSDASLFEFEWVGEDTGYGFVLLGFSVGAKSADISGDIVIPCEVVEKSGTVVKLMEIKQSAFANCINITSVIIPDGNDILIGRYAFKGCAGITNVTISKSVTEIGESTFSGCTSLTDVYFRGTKEQWDNIKIGEGNESLLNATIHYEWTAVTKKINEVDAKTKSLQYYGDANIVPSVASLFTFITDDVTMTAKISASWGADLGDLVIPYECEVDGKIYRITGLDGYAFEGCNITSVIFPNSIKDLGDCAFSGSSGFTTIEIPNGVSEIPMETFFSGNLQTIKIPSSVKYIYDRAFGTDLTDVFFEGAKEQWDAITIAEGNEALLNATIHYEYTDITKEYVDEKIKEVKEDIPIIDDELSDTSENAVQNKVVTEWIRILDTENSNNMSEIMDIRNNLEELTPSIEDNGDTESLDISIDNNCTYYNGVVSTSIICTMPEEIPLGFLSALYFVTPTELPENYSQFPANICFCGDSTDEGAFVPEPNMRYTIVFDFDGYMVNGYVKGVTTV